MRTGVAWHIVERHRMSGDVITTAFARIAKRTLRDRVADRLRSAILLGELAPGTPLTETALARQLDVSRAPLREAMRQLVEEGLLVSVAYSGTSVAPLSIAEVREIGSMRVTLERFAFELVWPRRDAGFAAELHRRHAVLTAAIDTGDAIGGIVAELDLHGLVYEASGHRLLMQTWQGLRGRLQLYWAAHRRAHGTRGPRRESHDRYIACALGASEAAMRAEIAAHMRLGLDRTEAFLRSLADDAGAADAPATPAPATT